MLQRVPSILRALFWTLTAIFMLTVIVGAGVWGFVWYRNEKLQREAAATKVWNVESALLGPFEVKFKTRCANQRLLYQLTLKLKEPDTEVSPTANAKQGFIPKASPAVQRLWSDVRVFHMNFEDDDGFRLIVLDFPREKWLNAVDDKNRHIGLTIDGEGICDPATYVRARKVNLGYHQGHAGAAEE